MIKPVSYPARPTQGGKLELAPPKRGRWVAEPKLNGWRALVHTPTGAMWNRLGESLTIADCFRPALAKLSALAACGIVWADCEALERRHNYGRGTLIVLDVIPAFAPLPYEARRAMLESLLPVDGSLGGDTSLPVPSGALVLAPTIQGDEALAFYNRLRAANRVIRCDFFEGVVMKREDSIYPVQLRSPGEKTRAWMKHRFLT
jgi:ATP-dependent DNA ligase